MTQQTCTTAQAEIPSALAQGPSSSGALPSGEFPQRSSSQDHRSVHSATLAAPAAVSANPALSSEALAAPTTSATTASFTPPPTAPEPGSQPDPMAGLSPALPPLSLDVLQGTVGIWVPKDFDPGAGIKSTPLPEHLAKLAPSVRVQKRYSTLLAARRLKEGTLFSINGHTLSRSLLQLPSGTDQEKLPNYFRPNELADLITRVGSADQIHRHQLATLQELVRGVQAHLHTRSVEIFGGHAKPRLPNLKISTVEFCCDLGPMTKAEQDRLFDEACRAAYHLHGKVYTERVHDKNPCILVKVPALDGTRFSNVQEVFIKIYRKEDEHLRIEVVIKNPKVPQPTSIAKGKKRKARQSYRYVEEMAGELLAFAQEAKLRISEVVQLLPKIRLAKAITESDLRSALKTYSVQGETRGLPEFIKQICETGVYDLYPVGEKQQIRRETRKHKLAHPTWGILEEVERPKKSGAGNQPFYRLRSDWRESHKNFNAEAVSRAKPPLERTIRLAEKLEDTELHALHKVIHKKLGIQDQGDQDVAERLTP